MKPFLPLLALLIFSPVSVWSQIPIDPFQILERGNTTVSFPGEIIRVDYIVRKDTVLAKEMVIREGVTVPGEAFWVIYRKDKKSWVSREGLDSTYFDRNGRFHTGKIPSVETRIKKGVEPKNVAHVTSFTIR